MTSLWTGTKSMPLSSKKRWMMISTLPRLLPFSLNWLRKSIRQSLRNLPVSSKKLGGVLGILQLDPEAFVKGAVDSVDEAAVEALIAERKAAKAAKNWARADEIRKELLEKNIVLEDAPGGVTTWRRA